MFFIFLGSALTGDQQLVVAMEFNGTLYEGVLFANKVTSSTAIAEAATTGGNNSTTTAIQSIPTTPASPKVASAAHNGITSPTSANLTAITSPTGRTTPVSTTTAVTSTPTTPVVAAATLTATNVVSPTSAAAAAAATIGIKRNSLDDRTTRVPHPLVSS